MRKATIVIGALLTAGMVVPPFALGEGSSYHERIASRDVSAVWTSCDSVAAGERCTYTSLEAFGSTVFLKDPDDVSGTVNERSDCVLFSQGLVVNTGGVNPVTVGVIRAQTCGTVRLDVAGSLSRARVEGELPAQRCDETTTPETCVDTTLRLNLEWRPVGDLRSSPNTVDRITDQYKRCLSHNLPSRTINATATGEIDGLLGPLGEVVQPYTYMVESRSVDVGTSHDCLD